MLRYYIGCLLLCISGLASGQGKLLIVGGGSEDLDAEGWSETPYGWLVDQAENKRIAVLSFNEETEVIPEYFVSLGATAAHNIQIDNQDLAYSEAMYDSLMGYDGFFIKGGDQSRYYETWRSSQVVRALIDKYLGGGVLGGTSAGLHILSGVVFTAENGSVYPEEGLENILDEDFTLKTNFLPFYSDYLFDSHFIERGRTFRLLSFLAHYNLNSGDSLKGLGVDDRTAMAIDSQGIGTVYGTGGVHWMRMESDQVAIDLDEGDFFSADSVVTQRLVAGDQLNLHTGELVSFDHDTVNVEPWRYTRDRNIFLDGSEEGQLPGNLFLINSQSIIREATGSTLGMLIRPRTLEAEGLPGLLEGRGFFLDELPLTAFYNSEDRVEVRNWIRNRNLFVWAEVTWDELQTFFDAGPTGALLKEHIYRDGITHVFLSGTSDLAGEIRVTNNLSDASASYRGRLEYAPGLNLIPGAIVMPHTIDVSTSDFYENNVSAVEYALTADSIQFGIYLSVLGNRKTSYFSLLGEDGKMQMAAGGEMSVVVVEDQSTALGSAEVRNVAAFDRYVYQVLNAGSEARSSGDIVRVPNEEYIDEIVPVEVYLGTREYDRIRLDWWGGVSGDGSGYIIYRGEDGTEPTYYDSTGTEIQGYIDRNTLPEVTYTYLVQAYNTDTISRFSEPYTMAAVTGLSNELLSWQVYPNPTTGNILRLQGEVNLERLSLWNSLGQEQAISWVPSGENQWEVRLPEGSGLQLLCLHSQETKSQCITLMRE